MTRTVLIFCVLSVVTAAGGCGEGRPEPSNAPQAPKISAGFKAYVDPVTGETLERPHEMAPALELDAMHTTSDRGLREIVSPEPGGGVSVDLEGRFRVPLEATVTPDRRPSIRHRDVPEAPRTTP
ncbi:MAG: hypothetical protein H0U97_09305 [Gammaproteobacteria bacterium]|nr:hypothetical protein [Gammaproteobacteria bacterium]